MAELDEYEHESVVLRLTLFGEQIQVTEALLRLLGGLAWLAELAPQVAW